METAAIVFGTLILLYLLFILGLYFAGKKVAARAVGGIIADCIILFKGLITDSTVKKRYKFVLILLIGYLAMPIDIVPDFIPVVGQLDDAIIVALALRTMAKGAGKETIIKHWHGPDSSLQALLKLARIS